MATVELRWRGYGGPIFTPLGRSGGGVGADAVAEGRKCWRQLFHGFVAD